MERLDPASTVLLVVDVQERLSSAMPPEALARLVKNTSILLETAKLLGVPVLASEQYPKGLGPTLPELRAKLDELGVAALPKTSFDACGDDAIVRALDAKKPKSVVVVGMESHVCVFQTARALVNRGHATHVVADAVSSRTEDNRAIGLALAEKAGAIVTATETVAFDLLREAGTDAFKAVSKLVR